MLRRLACIVLTALFTLGISACAEKECKITEKKEVQKESQPQDVSPGEMVVE